MTKTLLLTGAALIGLGMSGASAAEECGKVSLAEMNWPSAGAIAHIDKIILEKGYGCEVELVIGDTVPTFTSMTEKGEPDMAPELWVNTIQEPLDKAVEEGKLIVGSEVLSEGGVEGFWIPTSLAEEHNIKTLADALAKPELFPGAEDKSKGAFFNCPSGWACQTLTTNLFKAFEMESKGFDLVDTGSAAGLDGSISRAFERKEGWLGYYWAPTPILGKYEMTRLDLGVKHDAAEWERCTAVSGCLDPKPNNWDKSPVYTVVTREFADKAGVAMDYVKARSWDNKTAGEVLAWMTENQATNEDGAYWFLENKPEVWSTWVSPEVAEKVKSAL